MATKEKDINKELEVEEIVSKSEQFIENNSKKIIYGIIAVALVVGAVLGIKHGYLVPQEKKAAAAIEGTHDFKEFYCLGSSAKTTVRTVFSCSFELFEPMGITPAVVGSIEATEVLKIICGFGNVLADELWTIDLRTLQSNKFSL